MAPTITVVVREDPRKSHRPVEALRIALGLAAGEHDVTVVLLNEAPLLLTEDTEDIVDVEILEKYLPSYKQLAIPFVVTTNGRHSEDVQPDLVVQTQAPAAVHRLIAAADHTLVF